MENDVQPLEQREFEIIRDLINRKAGIELTDVKRGLIAGRLRSFLLEHGYNNYPDFTKSLLDDKTGRMFIDMVQRITTHHTFFNREETHFRILAEQIMPDLLRRRGAEPNIRIWSAACSTGEEPYSIAMSLTEALGAYPSQRGISILATDISRQVIEKARERIYPVGRITELPERSVKKYFDEASGDLLQIKTRLREEVFFRVLNLKRTSFPFRGKFDVIFLRNVLIYFDVETRMRLLEQLYDLLQPDGLLFIGHTESLPQQMKGFEPVTSALYQKMPSRL